jgi:hypothetical protein
MASYLFFRRNTLLLLLSGMGMLFSCSKSSFLDKKPNTNFIIPTTLPDFQALLDNDAVMGRTTALGELSADNLYLRDSFWLYLDAKERNAYIWAPGDIYNGQGQQDDWNLPYEQVFYANVVLDGLAKMVVDSTNAQDWKTLKGAALFTRAYAFYNLAQVFAPVYDGLSAPTDLGIPLRLSPDVNAPSVRASLQQTYSQILDDLRKADNLLPSALPLANRNRPSKPAAFAMQARVYLSMRAYDSARIYADSCLQLDSTLIDYNSLSTSSNFPFTILNLETIYQSSFFTGSNQSLEEFLCPDCVVDSGLYASYTPADLRRQVFYRRLNGSGYPNLKGSYSGSIYPFSGLATDEVYLVRAECRARAGDQTGALSDLNTLLAKRWMSGNFTPFMATTVAEALDTILVERRKELAFRGLRWTDLRRLNKEGANITLTRLLFGQTYQLPPNSPYYVLPIPPDVIALSGIQQNQRP